MVWYSHLFQNFPQFIVIHTVKGFGIVNKAEIDVFLELSCFFDDPADVGNLISGSSAFSKTSNELSHALWGQPRRAGMVERSDRMRSTGEGNGKPLQYSCLENPMNSMKRQNDRILKEELPRSVGAQYATGDQWRNNSRKNERMDPKQKQYPAVDVTGDRSKVRCCKEQYCIGTWNIRSMNQGKLEVVKQELARVNVDILGISELKWTGMGEFNSDRRLGKLIILMFP